MNINKDFNKSHKVYAITNIIYPWATLVSAITSIKIDFTLRMNVPFVTAHLEIFHCMHHPVIPKSDLYFTFCSTLNALSKRTLK